jgi:hypothetical protein
MTEPREDQLRSLLRDLAERASTTHDPTGPALRLARGMRGRRRAGVAAAGAAVLAAAVPTTLMVANGSPRTISPIGGDSTVSPTPPLPSMLPSTLPTQTPTPKPSMTQEPSPPGPSSAPTTEGGTPQPAPPPQSDNEIVLDLDALPAGAAPAVPWYGDKALHSGDRAVPFEVAFTTLTELIEVPTGFVVLVDLPVPEGEYVNRELFLVRYDGTRELLAEGAVVDPMATADGRRLAWAEHHDLASSNPKVDVVLASAETGKVEDRKRLPTRHGLRGVAGFVGDHVLLPGNGARDDTLAWNLATDQVKGWAPDKAFGLLDPTGQVAAVTETGMELCETYMRAADLEQLWETCGTTTLAISRGGSHAAAAHAPDWTNGYQWIGILDPVAKKALVGITVEHPVRAAFEPSGDLIFEAWKEKRSALVRCDLAGRCELATPLRTGPSDESARMPYRLGHRAVD